ncbi:MAG: serine hydrolase domain-containing protein [Steroidobacteraceae bacterium]
MKVKLAAVIGVLSAAPLFAQVPAQVAPEQVGFSKERLGRLRPQLEKYVEENRLAGGSALIARHGKVVYFETFGFMDKDFGKPMPKDAIFRIYSMTKPIIAVAALTLYEEGKFSLLEPVSKYLPEFSDMKVAVPAANGVPWHTVPAERPILILDLLRHTSGINNQGPKDANGEAIFVRLDIRSHSLADGIKLLASAPLVHQPQAGFDYSPGPDVMGRLIEVWSGMPLDQYLNERIFRPLHMTDTGFWVPEAKWSRLTTLYDRGPNDEIVRATGEPQDGYKTRPAFLSGAGGLVSTTSDYLRFAQMLLNRGQLDGVRILSPKSIELMSSDLLGDLPVFDGPLLPGYGFGLSVAVNRGPAKTATIGSAGEYYWEGAAASLFFVDPNEDLLSVFMVQKREGIAISREYKRMVYQAVVQTTLKR